MGIKKICLLGAMSFLAALTLFAQDWPIYKGNIYFTGNNDELIVPNNRLKWMFQADDQVFNPIASEGRIYFLDQRGQVYAVDEETGKLVYKVDLQETTARFKVYSRSAGKVKYPLIQGDTLFLTDAVAVYALNKKNGQVLWARTGMEAEAGAGMYSARGARPMIDGIYSDPVILGNKLFYGTRKKFMARETRNGHLGWDTDKIQSYSGFPTFYDDFVITQSMDYAKNRFMAYCLEAATGKEIWSKILPKPFKIFPAVVYQEKVFVPTGKKIFALDIKTGSLVWEREYRDLITSIPSFTERAILFTTGNSHMTIINPQNGEVIEDLAVAPQSGPRFVTVRDQLYLAYNEYEPVAGRPFPYGILEARSFEDKKELWNFRTPFPGAVSQPLAQGGILFLPAGNYLYAVGATGYNRVVQGGDGFIVEKDKKGNLPKEKPHQPRLKDEPEQEKKAPLREMKLLVQDSSRRKIPATVEVIKRDNGKITYQKKTVLGPDEKLLVPDLPDVEIVVDSRGYLPKKIIVGKEDKEKTVELDPLEQGKTYVVDNIYFELNKAYLKKESLDMLSRLVQIMRENPGMKLEVRGHTDASGTAAYNQKLSERRADAVMEYMIKQGISPERLRSMGLGQNEPVADNKTPEGRAKNRRTEFKILRR